VLRAEATRRAVPRRFSATAAKRSGVFDDLDVFAAFPTAYPMWRRGCRRAMTGTNQAVDYAIRARKHERVGDIRPDMIPVLGLEFSA